MLHPGALGCNCVIDYNPENTDAAMLDKIIAFSINNKFIIGLLTVAIVIWGGWSATQLSIDALPDITNNQVQIITLCPTLAGQEVEQLVTYPIEQSIANLPDLVELRSISRFGLSVVTVVFEDDVNVYFARQLINERLKEAEDAIPQGLGKPELAPVSTGLGEVYQYIVRPKQGSEDKYTSMDLRTMQDWIIARQLYGTPGIAEVNSFGGQLKQYEVAVNPDKLLAMGITIAEIFTALENNNENTGGAYIDKKPNAYFIRGVGLVSSFEDIRSIVVHSNPNGIPILIKDVADVRLGSAVRYGAVTYNGEEDVVGGVIMMLKGANSSDVVERVKDKLPVIQQSLPNDVVIEPYLDRTDLVDRAITTVESNLIEGALIVIFVLVLFLGNIRAGLIVASAIPLSMLIALGLMNVFGVSANLMSLGAIDFGLIVDGAVIIVEATLHHLGLRKGVARLSQREMDAEVYQSASRIRSSAAFGEIIILIVYIPILSLIGIEGKMFRPMAQTVSFAILGALVLSLTYIPMMCALFLPKTLRQTATISDRLMRRFQLMYSPLLEAALKLKTIIVVATVVLFTISAFLFARMGGEFIPTLAEGDFAFHCILPQGTSLSQSIETSMRASRIIKEFSEVKLVVGKTGSAEVPTDPMPPEATDIMIILKPQDEWSTRRSYKELGDEMMARLETIPGVYFEANQPIQMRFNELMTGIRQDVAVKIFGENLDTLLTYAQKVSSIISSVEGTSSPMVERVEGLPQISIRYNRSQIANYGLNINSINHVVSTAFAGGKAGVVFENERKFDLVVRLDSSHRNNIEDVRHLFIPTSNGMQIPLSQVAEITMELGPAQISREGGKRRIVIGFNVIDRDVASVVQEIEEKLTTEIELPEGYYTTYGGTFENLQAASRRLLLAVPLALVLIFVLLYFTFSSAKQALLVYAAIPMSAIGGVFALLIRGMPFSISAGVGFIALFGVAVLNGIVLIATFNQLEREGMNDVLQRIREGTKVRLRPVLMTAMVASLGFLPMAISQGAGAEVQRPLATVVIGGLISATFLTLIVLPLLYLMFSERRRYSARTVSIAISLLSITPLVATAQTPRVLTVNEAISLAIRDNYAIHARQYAVQSSQSMTSSVFELPKTYLSMQYGQYNSVNRDMSFQISQSIPFPSYYTAKSDVVEAELAASELQLQAVSNNVRAEVSSLYYQLIYLEQVRMRILFMDSLFSDFANAADLRYKTGETNLLANTSARTIQGNVRQVLLQNDAERATVYAHLKTLINSDDDFVVSTPQMYEPLQLVSPLDSSLLTSNPLLRWQYQNAVIAVKTKEMESAHTLPDLTLGYFNQSLIGVQNVDGSDVYYDQSTRFQGFNIGVSVPLTFFSSVARIDALGYQAQSMYSEAENDKRLMHTELQNALLLYNRNQAHYEYYKNTAVPNANIIISTAQAGFISGDIDYLEYLQAMRTAVDVEVGYLQSVDRVNQSVIRINYLLNK